MICFKINFFNRFAKHLHIYIYVYIIGAICQCFSQAFEFEKKTLFWQSLQILLWKITDWLKESPFVKIYLQQYSLYIENIVFSSPSYFFTIFLCLLKASPAAPLRSSRLSVQRLGYWILCNYNKKLKKNSKSAVFEPLRLKQIFSSPHIFLF